MLYELPVRAKPKHEGWLSNVKLRFSHAPFHDEHREKCVRTRIISTARATALTSGTGRRTLSAGYTTHSCSGTCAPWGHT